MANLTIAIDDDLLRRARIRALETGTSVNALLREYLQDFAVADASPGQSLKQGRAAETLRQDPRPVISTQVLDEFYVTVTRKFTDPMNPVQATAAVDRMRGWQIVPVDDEVVSTALQLTQRYQMSYWDAQVAASAARAGCQILLTEDLSGPDVILGVRRENPFASF